MGATRQIIRKFWCNDRNVARYIKLLARKIGLHFELIVRLTVLRIRIPDSLTETERSICRQRESLTHIVYIHQMIHAGRSNEDHVNSL